MAKPIVLTGGALRYALESLTKNQVIDLVVDRVKAELGEEAGDTAVAAKIDEWLVPVLAVRNDWPTSLVRKMIYWRKAADDYLIRMDAKLNRGG